MQTASAGAGWLVGSVGVVPEPLPCPGLQQVHEVTQFVSGRTGIADQRSLAPAALSKPVCA